MRRNVEDPAEDIQFFERETNLRGIHRLRRLGGCARAGCFGWLCRAAEAPQEMNAAQIRLALEKLNVLGRVLYIAAHPDDENTGLISYWENGALYDAAYLSLTRGDGGQNLIGPELRDQLGVIRTQELLAARRIDHGQQFFTRANDFGFSKSAEETLRIWDREKILADVVWVIRKFQPDLVVTRFPTKTPRRTVITPPRPDLRRKHFGPRATRSVFPSSSNSLGHGSRNDSLEFLGRLPRGDAKRALRLNGLISLEVGGYQPLLGKSFPEIAAASRSMHKSQGFGVEIGRGERKEYFKFLDGKPSQGSGIFDGIDTTWARVPKSYRISDEINDILKDFDARSPSKSVPALLELAQACADLAMIRG